MISVCIITKNESENLRKCLTSVSNYPVEIVVVDTGSIDNSIEVAKEFTSNVYTFDWCDDFSAARNYAASVAPTDIILALDTDEYVEEADFEKAEELLLYNPSSAGRILIRNAFYQNGETMICSERISRIYSRTNSSYEGKIHEQISASTHIDIPVTIFHTGYLISEEEKNIKATRNLALLIDELKTSFPNYDNSSKYSGNDLLTLGYLTYQIGKAYYFSKDYDNSYYWFEYTLSLGLDSSVSFMEETVNTFIYSAIKTEKASDAEFVTAYYEAYRYSADFLLALGLLYMNLTEFNTAIATFNEATACDICSIEGANSYLAYYNAGVIEECLGNIPNAIEYYKKSKAYSKARERLYALTK